MTAHANAAARALLLLAAAVAGCSGPVPGGTTGPSQGSSERWYASWTTAHTGRAQAVSDQSLRVVMQLSVGGNSVRVRLRNQFGTTPVSIGAASVGIVDSGPGLVAGSSRALTFAGQPGVRVEAGQDVTSDPVSLATAAQQALAVSLHVLGEARPSQDGQAYLTSYMSPAGSGNHVAEEAGSAFSATTNAALLVGSVEVQNAGLKGLIIGVGGSTTDGVGSDGKIVGLLPSPAALLFPQPECAPCRWTDFLARRIAQELPADEQFAVGNEGIAGNTTQDVLDRYDADVLSHASLSHVILYSGANDLGSVLGDDADTIIANMKSAIDRAHAVGAKVIVATINPRAHFTPLQNLYRDTVNTWIRTNGNCDGYCDGMVDFDAALAWSLYPDAINPVYDSGDTIHPTPAGYKAMADAVDLDLFRGQ